MASGDISVTNRGVAVDLGLGGGKSAAGEVILALDPVAATWAPLAGGGGSPVVLVSNVTIAGAAATSTALGGTQTHPGGLVRGCYVSLVWGGVTGASPTVALGFQVLGADGTTWVTYGPVGSASAALSGAGAASASIYPAATFAGAGAAMGTNATALAESAVLAQTRGLPHQFRVVAVMAVNPSSLTGAYAQLHWLT